MNTVHRTVAALALSSIAAAAFANPPSYQVVDLGTLGGVPGVPGDHYYSVATGMNASGTVVGYSFKHGSDSHIFVYENGAMTDVTIGPKKNAYSAFINDAGTIVLSKDLVTKTTSTPTMPDILQKNAKGRYVPTAMPDLAGCDLQSTSSSDWCVLGLAGIDNAGRVLVQRFTGPAFQTIESFRFANGGYTDLGPVQAMAQDDQGNFGGVNAADWGQGFVDMGGTQTLVGLDGASYSAITAFNANGQAAGTTYVPGTDILPDPKNAFVYADGALQNLPGTGLVGAYGQAATAINANGWVVGQEIYFAPANHLGEGASAYLYMGGHSYTLNSLIPAGSGWDVQQAVAINAAGQIAATACNASIGACHAVRLDPN